ncbi:MAG: hypothetical protein VB054_04830 [Petrimonas sp.]|jgi:hypothetical protein|nr:hypothetical protein [Petrimonas sp.]
MAQAIHINTARKIFEAKEAMDLKFWKADGSIVNANNVICTSSYFHNNTINIKFLMSNQFRKVRVVSIFEVNGMEVFM